MSEWRSHQEPKPMRAIDECPACGATSPKGEEVEDLYRTIEKWAAEERKERQRAEAAEARERALREAIERIGSLVPLGTTDVGYAGVNAIRAALDKAKEPMVKNETTVAISPCPWCLRRPRELLVGKPPRCSECEKPLVVSLMRGLILLKRYLEEPMAHNETTEPKP
jgi:hypothetical protein